MQSLAHALLFGKLGSVSPETLFLLSRTGLVHLFSASGFHLLATLEALSFVLKPLRRLIPAYTPRGERAWRLVELAVSLCFLALLGSRTGWGSPMVRAFLASLFLLLSRCFEWDTKASRIFFVSALVSFFIGRSSPLSWLLSTLSTGALFWAQKQKKPWLLPLAPWIWSLPVSLAAFGCLGFFSPLYNLLLGPPVSLVSFPLAFLGLVTESLGLEGVSAWLYHFSSLSLEWFFQFLAVLDHALGAVYWVSFPKCILYFVAFLALCRGFKGKRERRALWGALAVCAFLSLAVLPKSAAVLDVGQGDSNFLQEEGTRVLVDAGPASKAPYPAKSSLALERYGIGTLDEIVLTHPDADHVAGLASLLSRHPVRGSLWMPEDALRFKQTLPLVAAAESRGLPWRWVRNMSSPAPKLTCLVRRGERTTNESGPLCSYLLPSGKRLLLTGDLGIESERYFLETNPGFLRADFLKLGHHGSRYSSGEEFLAAVGARIALISAGWKNRYGHPHKETLKRLQDVFIRRTDTDGTLWIE